MTEEFNKLFIFLISFGKERPFLLSKGKYWPRDVADPPPLEQNKPACRDKYKFCVHM